MVKSLRFIIVMFTVLCCLLLIDVYVGKFSKSCEENFKKCVNRVLVLKDQIKELKELNEELSNNCTAISRKYKELYEKVLELENKLEVYRKNLNLSEEVEIWVNRNFYYDFSNYSFIKDIKDLCLEEFLNLPCVIEVLMERYGFEYIKENVDKIKSVDRFVKDKGGDCEDWSLFISSLINYFKKRYYIVSILVCKYSEGSKMYLYKMNNKIYYLKNCKSFEINLSVYNKVSIICYLENSTYGHCIIGLSNEFLSPNNLNNTRVFLIESQSGELLGTLDTFNKDIYLLLSPSGFFIKKWGWWI